MKNKYYINKANKLTDKIKSSVFDYNRLIRGMSTELDRLEESNDYYHKGYIEFHDRIEEAIEYLENHKYYILPTDLLDILKGVDKE